MTDNELKKLGRSDLLQMLVEQGRELQQVKQRCAALEAQLADREIKIDSAGSIAEAALQLNGVFEAAQAACRQYTENIANLSSRQEAVCAKMEAESSMKAAGIIAEAEAKSAQMLKDAKEQSQAYWNEVYAKTQTYLEKHAELQKLLSFGNKGEGAGI